MWAECCGDVLAFGFGEDDAVEGGVEDVVLVGYVSSVYWARYGCWICLIGGREERSCREESLHCGKRMSLG